jgi:hypothetical protein
MTDDEITKIADRCGMYECHDNGRINGNTVLDFARAILDAAAPAQTAPNLPIVLALARCGIAQEPPSNAFLHQLRRLTESLPPDDARHFKALLDWHDAGREKSTVKVVQSAPKS